MKNWALGQEAIAAQLNEEFGRGRIPNAKMFLGDTGFGGLNMARYYAALLLCESPSKSGPCESCGSCKKVVSTKHPDLFYSYPVYDRGLNSHDDIVMEDGPWQGNKYYSSDFIPEWKEQLAENTFFNMPDWVARIATANKQMQIPVWESRKIVKTIPLSKVYSDRRVFIIWKPEFLRADAANTLLKVIEEPPKGNIFLLVGEQYDQVLPTITSRLQLIRMLPYKESDVEKALLAEDYSAEDAKEKSQLSSGNMRNAREDNQELTTELLNLFKGWIKALSNAGNDFDPWLREVESKSREMQKAFLVFCLDLLHHANWQYNDISSEWSKPVEVEAYTKKLAGIIHEGDFEGLVFAINKALSHLTRNANSRILFHDLSMIFYNKLVGPGIAAG